VISPEALHATGLVTFNCEARCLIQQRGVKLNGEKIGSADMTVVSVGDILLLSDKQRFVRVLLA